jgi:hypothetical protein
VAFPKLSRRAEIGERFLHYGTGISFFDSVHPSPPMPRWAAALKFVLPMSRLTGARCERNDPAPAPATNVGCPIEALFLGLSGTRSTQRPSFWFVIRMTRGS